MSLFDKLGKSSKEVTLKVVSTYSETMFVDEDGNVGKTTVKEYIENVKKGDKYGYSIYCRRMSLGSTAFF